MTTYEKMTTRELDAWIREGGKDLCENAQTYTPAKYRLVAHMVRSAVREKLRRLHHADWLEKEYSWETERAIRGGTGWS